MPTQIFPIVTKVDIPRSGQTLEERIESTAIDLLRSTPYRALKGIDCRFRDGVLTLRGQVESYFLKQVAQEKLLPQLGASVTIDNRVEVSDPGRSYV